MKMFVIMEFNSKYFQLALKKIIQNNWLGRQKIVSDAVGIKQGYLSELVHGKKSPSEKLRRKFYHFLGMTEAEMMEYGCRLADENDTVGEPVLVYAKPSVESKSADVNGALLSGILSDVVPDADDMIEMIKLAVKTKKYKVAAMLLRDLADEIEKGEKPGFKISNMGDKNGKTNNDDSDDVGNCFHG